MSFLNKSMFLWVSVALLVGWEGIRETEAQAMSQSATLFADANAVGQSLQLDRSSNNLAKYNWDDIALSAKTTGAVIFYENADFNAGGAGLVKYVFGPNNNAAEFPRLGRKVSSIRFVGLLSDYKASTLTLFQDDWFQGAQELIYKDKGNLNLDSKAASLVVTGLSPWTCYTQPSFEGEGYCVHPPQAQYFPAFVVDTKEIGIQNGVIRSARLGCHGQTFNREDKSSKGVAGFSADN